MTDLDVASGAREVVLTFDDGPDVDTTSELLDILAALGIRAMFFVKGQSLRSDFGKALIRRAHYDGHVIGNHTFRHRELDGVAEDVVRKSLHVTHNLIGECTGTHCRYFRAPYGVCDEQAWNVIGEMNYAYVGWNIDTKDWKSQNQEGDKWVDISIRALRKRIRRGLQSRSVVLMHDTRSTTVRAIGQLVDRIHAIGACHFVVYENSDAVPGSIVPRGSKCWPSPRPTV